MARVTGAELKEIIDTNKADTLLESQFIRTANLFVDEHLLGEGYSANMLKVLELYLAAHFLAISEEKGGLVVDHYGEGTERYADVYEGGLKLTRFGQQAIALDSSGVLAKFDAKKRAEFRVV